MLLIFAFAEGFSALVKVFRKSGLKVYVMNVKNSNFSLSEMKFSVASCKLCNESVMTSVCERDYEFYPAENVQVLS